jgi:hypothetical protein
VLLDAVLAAERLGDDRGGVVVAIAGEVRDLDPGVGKRLADQALDFGRFHRHRGRFPVAFR